MSISELSQLVSHLDPQQRRLVRLFAEALLLVQDGQTEIRDRLRLIERTFGLSLYLMRRRVTDGTLQAEHLTVLDRELGISLHWILAGDTGALAERIVVFCREKRVH